MDATAQLKGIMGISGAAASQPTASDNNNNNNAATADKSSNSNSNNQKNKGKKNKNRNANGKGKKPQNHQQQQSQNNQNQNKNKKNKKQQKGNNQKNNNTRPPQDTNFAWSAFQSSPDASKLPIPAFSPTESKPINQIPASAGAPPPVAAMDNNTASTMSIKPQESKTGVNLAAALKSPSQTPAKSNASVVASPSFHPPPPPPPPPGFVTIQVQVPPYLPPNRQMLVQSPVGGGYPVQVTVPQGIPPGAIIPVHVPTMPPLHMMPPHAQQQIMMQQQRQPPQSK